MIVLALDIGDARCGIAWGDTNTKIASPVCVLPMTEVVNLSKSFCNIVDEYQPEKLICGLPKSLSGQDSTQTTHVVEIAKSLAQKMELPLEFVDERLSSKQAKNILRQQGLTERQMRGKIDSVAASLFLESWLNIQD